MDMRAVADTNALEPVAVRRFLLENPHVLTEDAELLSELGLKALPPNVVEFTPAALARVHEAHKRESAARQQLEATARDNFHAQSQTHGAVIDLLSHPKSDDKPKA